MLRETILKNKVRYQEYNGLRKKIFSEAAPADSELILHLLPWLLSINHEKCPGFIPNMKTPFHVFNVELEKEIRAKEARFKKRFGVAERGTFLKPKLKFCLIQGLYTIGSIGTISQTPDSDCDIWVCYRGSDFDEEQLSQLKEKLELIKTWFEKHCRIEVYFFPSEIEDVRNCRFGTVDEESCGSCQANVLKEEFYRTCIVICGKIPLWWLCYGTGRGSLAYGNARLCAETAGYLDDDIVDLGNLENVRPDEYFGASLWQLNKSLHRPLKSIIKMLLLKMQLDAVDEELVCHRFRQHVMVKSLSTMIPDPAMFSMYFIMDYYQRKSDRETLQFITECFYLRCGGRKYGTKSSLRKQLARMFFKQFKLAKSTRIKLDQFADWKLEEQIFFGKRLFQLLIDIYKGITESHTGVAAGTNTEDIVLVGRKIKCCYEKKEAKIQVLPLPSDTMNVSRLFFVKNRDGWRLYSGKRDAGLLFAHPSLLTVISFAVKNGFFESGWVYMMPNPSEVTIQDIISTGLKIISFFDSDVARITAGDYRRASFIKKCLVIAGFEKTVSPVKIDEITVLYVNSWGEMFVETFSSLEALRRCLKRMPFEGSNGHPEIYMPKRYLNRRAIISSIAAQIKKPQ